jgi:hypothetical protein
LGAKWTASVYVKGSHGRLVVKYHRKPTQEEMERVEDEANRRLWGSPHTSSFYKVEEFSGPPLSQ